MIKVGLLGHGVVGSGVAEMLMENAKEIARAAGEDISLARVLDLQDFSHLGYGALFTRCFDDIISDPSITVVVECMGGVSPAGDFARRTLKAGKSFVTSNKAMVVACGAELKALAKENRVSFLYEASCCGGIPVLRSIRHCLAGNRIHSVSGILNGTTNYILTRMQGGATFFETALDEAKRLGYAEADPTADIEGHDARRKLAILASLCFDANLEDDEKIPCEGIARITRQDMRFAASLMRVVRLVARAVRDGDAWHGRVCPVMLPATEPLAIVRDSFNAVMLRGGHVGDVMLYGRGAGKEPTASAVVGDIIECVRLSGKPWDTKSAPAPAYTRTGELTRLFFRMPVAARDQAERAFPKARIVTREESDIRGEIAVITQEAPLSELSETVIKLASCGASAPIRYEGA